MAVIGNQGVSETAQMLNGGISEPRNKTLLKLFNLIGVGEHAGSGVPDIFEAWKKEKLEAPTVEEHFGADKPDRTIINLPLKSAAKSAEKPAEKSAESWLKIRHKQILFEMQENREYSSEEISEIIELKLSQTKKLLKELTNINYIEAKGDTKGRRYRKNTFVGN